MLVDYKADGAPSVSPATSLTRGDGACEEILYAETALTLVAPGDHLRASAARLLRVRESVALLGSCALWLAQQPGAE